MARILVIGRKGQLARALVRCLTDLDRAFEQIGSDDIDLVASPETIFTYIKSQNISGVVNASAYTDVDGAEKNITRATQLNTVAPGYMARACAEKSIPFIHISTDYVFDGLATEPYLPDAPVNPINTYGLTKAEGERAVFKAGGRVAILRTSWLYDGSGKNFLTTMLHLAENKKRLRIVDDQIGRPTYAGDLAKACLAMLDHMPDEPTIYHVSNTGEPISWAIFARNIFDLADVQCTVEPIPTLDYPTPANRPKFSVLDTEFFEDTTGHFLPHWRDGLRDALAERP